MRTKPIASYRSELLPGGRELALSFDGLIGLEPWLALWLEEWARRFPREFVSGSEPGRARWNLWTYGRDYASYGIGGGDTTLDVFVAVCALFRVDADHPFRGHPPGWLVARVGANPALLPPTVVAFLPDRPARSLEDLWERKPPGSDLPDPAERTPGMGSASVGWSREAPSTTR